MLLLRPVAKVPHISLFSSSLPCVTAYRHRRGQASLSSSARIHRLVLEDLTEDSDAGARYARCFAEISSRIVRLKEASPGLTVRVFVPHLFSAHVYADLDSASVCRCVARTLLCLRSHPHLCSSDSVTATADRSSGVPTRCWC